MKKIHILLINTFDFWQYFLVIIGTAYEKYLTDDMYPEDLPIEDSPTDISREDDLDDGSTYIDDGNFSFNFDEIFYKKELDLHFYKLA